MSLVSMTATVEQAAGGSGRADQRLARFARPALGLLLPVALAVLWEFAVRIGLSNGRLVPPPSVIFATFAELAAHRRAAAPRAAPRCRASPPGFAFGVAAGTVVRRHRRLFGADPPPARSDPAGAARDPVDRLGAAVHPVVRHLRSLQDHADRGRRVLSGLSRRHGRDPVGRPQDRRGRPRVPAVRPRHGAPHPVAGGAAGLCDRRCAPGSGSAGCSWSPPNSSAPPTGLGYPADRRPAARQAGADRRRHRRLRDPRQDHRLAASSRAPRRSCAGKTASRAA